MVNLGQLVASIRQGGDTRGAASGAPHGAAFSLSFRALVGTLLGDNGEATTADASASDPETATGPVQNSTPPLAADPFCVVPPAAAPTVPAPKTAQTENIPGWAVASLAPEDQQSEKDTPVASRRPDKEKETSAPSTGAAEPLAVPQITLPAPDLAQLPRAVSPVVGRAEHHDAAAADGASAGPVSRTASRAIGDQRTDPRVSSETPVDSPAPTVAGPDVPRQTEWLESRPAAVDIVPARHDSSAAPLVDAVELSVETRSAASANAPLPQLPTAAVEVFEDAAVAAALRPIDEPSAPARAAAIAAARMQGQNGVAATADDVDTRTPSAQRPVKPATSGVTAEHAAKANAPAAPSGAPLVMPHVAAPALAAVLTGSVVAPSVESLQTSETLPDSTVLQIVRAIRLQAMGNGGEARITLEPRHFGEMTVSIRVEQGQVTARLEAESPFVREWLQNNQGALRHQLAGQQLTLDSFEVAEPGESNHARHRGSSDNPPPQDGRQGRRPRRDQPPAHFEVVA
ncbi:MAG: flagellar hook-length control protein FliK [Vicinamibacterales bacterium]